MEIICSSPRLYLRKFNDDDTDADYVFELNKKPEVLRYLHEPLLTSTADARAVLQEKILPQYELKLGRWAVHLKETNQFIGWCGLKQRPERNMEIDLGYRFLSQFWGKG